MTQPDLERQFKLVAENLARDARDNPGLDNPRKANGLTGRPLAGALPPLQPGGAAVVKRDFVHLAEEIGKAMIQAAEEQLVEAQNMVDRAQALADQLVTQIQEKNQELDAMNDRLRTFAQTVLDAHNQFHGDKA